MVTALELLCVSGQNSHPLSLMHYVVVLSSSYCRNGSSLPSVNLVNVIVQVAQPPAPPAYLGAELAVRRRSSWRCR